MRKVLRHPLATVVFGLLLVGSFSLLPNTSLNRSKVRAFFETPAYDDRAMEYAWIEGETSFEFVRGGEGIGDKWTRVDLDQSSDGYLPQYENAKQFILGHLRSATFRSGFWAPVTRTEEFRMMITPARDIDVVPTGASRDEFRLVYADYLATAPEYKEIAAKLREGEYTRRTIIWTGVLHNIASLIVAALFFRSLAWVPEIPRRIRRKRRENLILRRQCPACTYSIEGLTVQTCPECGSPLPASPEASTETQPASARA